MRDINLIVIHCSATPNGMWVSPAQIDAWHAKRGFKRELSAVARFQSDLPHIGYHRLILAGGQVEYGRAIEEVGAHALNHNANSIGICMVGTNFFFESQWLMLTEQLCEMASWLQEMLPESERGDYSLSPTATLEQFKKLGIRIVGHRDLSPDLDGDGKIESNEWLKTCPGFDVAEWLGGGMQPLQGHILDDCPAITSASAAVRIAAKVQL